jgi:hypothetical protein
VSALRVRMRFISYIVTEVGRQQKRVSFRPR